MGWAEMKAAKAIKPGQWNCAGCYVINEVGAIECVSCETPKPGCEEQVKAAKAAKAAALFAPKPAAAAPVASTGGFSFGVGGGAAAAPAASTGGFSFGVGGGTASSAAAAPAATTGGFKFGAAAAEAPKSAQAAKPKEAAAPAAGGWAAMKAAKAIKEGQWKCAGCYVINEADALECVCCEMVHEGKEEEAEIKDTTQQPANSTETKLSSACPGWLQEHVTAISSDSVESQLAGAKWFRMKSSERTVTTVSTFFDEVIAAGVVPRFVELLDTRRDPSPPAEVQFEAAWVLTNIASSNAAHTQAVIESGAVPVLVHVLRDAVGTTDDTRDQAMWALGNIAGDSSGCRDLVLQEAGLTSLVAQLMESSRVSTLRQGTWALSNFCRGKPPPAFHAVSPAIPCVVHLLSTCEDAEVLSDVCWTISYLTLTTSQIQAIIDGE
jgi:hypothetical protein